MVLTPGASFFADELLMSSGASSRLLNAMCSFMVRFLFGALRFGSTHQAALMMCVTGDSMVMIGMGLNCMVDKKVSSTEVVDV